MPPQPATADQRKWQLKRRADCRVASSAFFRVRGVLRNRDWNRIHHGRLLFKEKFAGALRRFHDSFNQSTRSFPSSSSRMPSIVQPAGVVTRVFQYAG